MEKFMMSLMLNSAVDVGHVCIVRECLEYSVAFILVFSQWLSSSQSVNNINMNSGHRGPNRLLHYLGQSHQNPILLPFDALYETFTTAAYIFISLLSPPLSYFPTVESDLKHAHTAYSQCSCPRTLGQCGLLPYLRTYDL